MGALLGACALIGAAACSDVPTGVEPARSVDVMDANVQREVGVVEVVCATSRSTPGGQYAYEYGLLTVRLPASTRAADGRLRAYRYRGYAQGRRVVLAADCAIPDTEAAYKQMNLRFGVKPEKAGQGWKGGGAVPLSGDYILDGLEVNACRYGGEYPDCEPQPTANPTQTDHQPCWGAENCGDGYTPTGGGNNATPPTPCNTGDQVIDSPAVQQSFDRLWRQTNATGLEAGAWVVRNADGSYTTTPLTVTTASACGIDFRNNPPAGTVAWVHTHPFSPGDMMGACGTPNLRYLGGASPHDQQVTDQLGGMRGFALDGRQINVFHGSAYQIQRTYQRCGY